MTDSFIRIITYVTALSGKEAELRSILLRFVEQHCQEVGSISCELLQDQLDSTEFLLLQQWESEARLKSEICSKHLREALEKGAELLAEPIRLNWYQMVGPEPSPAPE